MEIRAYTGPEFLARFAARLDELHRATGAPVTARRTWLTTWVECHPGHEPLALLAEAGDRLEGAVLLARREGRLATELVALGAGLSDQIRLPARSAAAAHALSDAVLERLRANRRAWSLTIRHLPAQDPIATRVAAGLACAELEVGDASPTLRFGDERSVRAHVSRNHHQQVRRMLNRMHSDGLEPRVEHLRTSEEVAAVLPEVEEVCLQRDVELRGESLLDHRSTRTFFARVVLAHAERGEVELTTLRLRGELAAYVLCFVDGPAYRMWNCRLAPAWGHYGAGRIANHAALEHALADPRANEFDWMRGAESYKLSLSNDVLHALDLRAWSTPALRALLDSPRRVRRMVKAVAAEHAWMQPALAVTRRLKVAGRRRSRSLREALKGASR
jgi:CelD/BcsL family acetyltransferase involved in cellulose biosynthesis